MPTDTNEMATDTSAHEEAATVALAALSWILSDERRAERFLALTGLTPDEMRAAIGDQALLGAVLKFLEGHEPDLIACAEALDRDPARLVAARRELER
ncbi:MAG: DUF3572 domain-containing protein [Sphingomonadaceae bacterium]|nr:DUF3572 domain-containing protein [Sphingomonadaceae bacterium]